MRILALFLAGIVLAALPSEAAWVTTTLPPGGISLVAPGYSFRTPGAGWTSENPQALKDGVPTSSSTGTWSFRKPDAGTGVLVIGSFEWPHNWRGVPADLPAVVDFPGYDFESMSSKGAVASSSVVHGAVCAGKRFAREGRIVYHRICLHPDYASFGLSLRFSITLGPDAAAVERELMAVLDSLTFTPLDFRVRELRTSLLTHMAFAEGAFWALNWDEEGGGKLLRIDPKTNAITAAIPVNSLPGNLEVSAGAIWVSGDTAVRRIDPKTNTITGTYPAGELGARLLPDDRGVWVEWTTYSSGWFLPRHMSARGYALLNASSGKLGRKIEMPITNRSIQTPYGLFYISGYRIQQFDAAKARVTERMAVAPDTEVMRYDGRFLWLGGGYSGNGYSILRYDPQTPDVPPVPVRPTPAPARDFVEWNGLTCILMKHAVQCLADDGRVATQFPLQGEIMAGLTVQDGSLWVMPEVGYALIRLDPK